MRLPLGPELLLGDVAVPACSREPSPDGMGALPIFLVLGKGVASAGRAVGNVVQNLAARTRAREAEAKARRERKATILDLRATVAAYRREVQVAPSEGARVRARERLDAAQDRLEEAVARDLMRRQGLDDGDSCAVLEMRRNLLASTWRKVGDARKRVVEARVAAMDRQLGEAHRNRQIAEQASPEPSGSAARILREAKTRPLPSKRRLAGEGGLSFEVVAPPGQGRLCRIPFYPVNGSTAWVGANGIDEANDCPVIDLRISAGQRTVGPLLMRTPIMDYGVYRILGLQVNLQSSYRHTPIGGSADDVAVALSDLTVYNGKDLFPMPIGTGVDARTFLVRQLGTPNIGPALGAAQERPFVWDRRRNRFFAGLRDYPTMTDNAQATVALRAHTQQTINATNLRVPVTVNLIVEILEDRVYGDPVNPSAAARAGALVKVGTRSQGISTTGKERLELVSSRYVPSR